MVDSRNVSGTARPTVAADPCGLMLAARLAPIAATDRPMAPQVTTLRFRAGDPPCDSANGGASRSDTERSPPIGLLLSVTSAWPADQRHISINSRSPHIADRGPKNPSQSVVETAT